MTNTTFPSVVTKCDILKIPKISDGILQYFRKMFDNVWEMHDFTLFLVVEKCFGGYNIFIKVSKTILKSKITNHCDRLRWIFIDDEI